MRCFAKGVRTRKEPETPITVRSCAVQRRGCRQPSEVQAGCVKVCAAVEPLLSERCRFRVLAFFQLLFGFLLAFLSFLLACVCLFVSFFWLFLGKKLHVQPAHSRDSGADKKLETS